MALQEMPLHLASTQQGDPCRRLILSCFPGIDLLGYAFELEMPEACIVRGPDPIFGKSSDIRTFHPPDGVFWGMLGCAPCQEQVSAEAVPGPAGLTLPLPRLKIHRMATPREARIVTKPTKDGKTEIYCVDPRSGREVRTGITARGDSQTAETVEKLKTTLGQAGNHVTVVERSD